MTERQPSHDELILGVHDLRMHLTEVQETLEAIRRGEVDALVVRTGREDRVYTLKSADYAYRVLFELLNEGALTVGGDSTILYANGRFGELVGQPIEAVLGAPLSRFIAPGSRDAFAALLARGTEGRSKGECELTRADGSRVSAMLSMNAVYVEGAESACTVVVSDLTQILEAQAALERANAELEARVAARTSELRLANAALEESRDDLRQQSEELKESDRRKDEFLSMLSHELRNPLAPVLNSIEVLRVRAPEDPLLHRHVGVIERQVRQMARLVDDLLDVSRISRRAIALRPEPVSLADLAARAIDSVRPALEARGHTLEVDLPPHPAWIEADPTRLEQVLVNILNNAVKYTDPGGVVRLAVESGAEDVVIRIRDSGIGIPPELLPRIFDLFVQGDRSLDRSLGGLGIGLTLTKRLVELHGGSIEARSEGVPGRGSEFVLRLPYRAATAPAARPGTSAPEMPERRAVDVLVVEDNPDTAATLAELLEIWGHRVRVAHRGEEAVRMARRDPPQVVLCDLGLPGMDGYAVARELAKLGTAMVLVAVTGYGQDEDRRLTRAAGFDAHLTKPVDPSSLRLLLDGLSTA